MTRCNTVLERRVDSIDGNSEKAGWAIVHKLKIETKVGLLKQSMCACAYGVKGEMVWDGIARCPIYSPVPPKLPLHLILPLYLISIQKSSE